MAAEITDSDVGYSAVAWIQPENTTNSHSVLVPH